MGEIAINMGRAVEDETESHFEESLRILRELGALNELAFTFASLAKLHRQKGRVEQAKDCLNESLEIFERLGTLLEPNRIRAEIAVLEGIGDMGGLS